jgi:glutamate racemase
MSAQKPIGVFDSGLGGLSVLKSLREELPNEDFIYLADTGNAPYGERGDEFVAQRSLSIATELVERHGAKLLVVACNTATAAAVHVLRGKWPGLPVVGVEPGLKPAARLTRTGRVGVMATRGTLASAKFRALHESLEDQADFVLQPCDGLAGAIERNDAELIGQLSARYTHALGRFGMEQGEIDTLVLGCTHYVFALEHLVQNVGSSVQFVETGQPVARQARAMLDSAQLSKKAGDGKVRLLSTGDLAALESFAARWLG